VFPGLSGAASHDRIKKLRGPLKTADSAEPVFVIRCQTLLFLSFHEYPPDLSFRAGRGVQLEKRLHNHFVRRTQQGNASAEKQHRETPPAEENVDHMAFVLRPEDRWAETDAAQKPLGAVKCF